MLRYSFYNLVLITLLKFTLFPISIFGSVNIVDGEYKGINVALHSTFSSSQCEELVRSLEGILKSASQTLHDAAFGLSYGEVEIIVPLNWRSCGRYPIKESPGYATWNKAAVRVGESHPIFGDNPWTLQPRGCGGSGEFISLSENWIFSKELTNVQKGKKFVQEWAKYRWGVFEEYGHMDDPIFPSFLPNSEDSLEPNLCTDRPLRGYMEGHCGRKSGCNFVIDNSSDVTSSLMSVTNLPDVHMFCDNSNHRKNISTKHNLLCDQRSVLDVMKTHSDFTSRSWQNENSRPSSGPSATVVVVKENFSRNVVIAYEISKSMEDIVNRFNYEKEAIAQFILYEIPQTTRLGLISFASTSSIDTKKLVSLDLQNKKDLAKLVMSKRPVRDELNVNLLTVIKDSVQLLDGAPGLILIVTKSEENLRFSAQELADSTSGNPIWVILYPKPRKRNVDVFLELASLTSGRVITIDDEIVDSEDGSHLSPMIRWKLSQALRQTLHIDPKDDMREIDQNICEKTEVICARKLNIPTNKFSKKMLLYVYQESGDIIDYDTSSVDVIGGSCTRERFANLTDSIKTTKIEKCNVNPLTSEISVTIVRKRHHDILIMELVGKPRQGDADNPVSLNIFGSSSLADVRYSENFAPILYTQIFYREETVIFGNVSALIKCNNKVHGITIILKDDGLGADITGNDGVYSGYIFPVLPEGEFEVIVSADDNQGKAKLLSQTNENNNFVCCGSVLPISDELPFTDQFDLTSLPVVGHVSLSEPYMNYPPGQIKDLKLYEMDREEVQLTFTATGRDLNHGTASKYVAKVNNKDVYLGNAPLFPGAIETIDVEVECGLTTSISVAAIDNQGVAGKYSNDVVVFLPCGGLSAGGKAGIIILVILIIVIVVLYILYKRRKEGKSIEVRKFICCCNRKQEEKRSSRNNEDTHNVVISVQEIKSANDLIRNMEDSSTQKSAVLDPKTPLCLNQENVYAELKEKFEIEEEQRLKLNVDENKSNKEHQKSQSTLNHPEMTKTYSDFSQDSSDSIPTFVPRGSINEVGIPLLPTKQNKELTQAHTSSPNHTIIAADYTMKASDQALGQSKKSQQEMSPKVQSMQFNKNQGHQPNPKRNIYNTNL